MEVIQSFTIDHTHLKPGIYISREDKGFTTYDLRITEPNKEPAMGPGAIHSLEHLMATWFRNSEVKEDVVYTAIFETRPLTRPVIEEKVSIIKIIKIAGIVFLSGCFIGVCIIITRKKIKNIKKRGK